jgi:hypothetical protein
MEIWVEFDSSIRKFRVSPNPAIVKRGTSITWRFRADNFSGPGILWTVYFDQGTPFAQSMFTTGSAISNGQHTGATTAKSADKPGDYKYGVRAQDSSTKNKLGDEDPILRVQE